MIVFTIEHLRLVNTSNLREHWSEKARRTASQRLIARARTHDAMARANVSAPYDATIVRIGPGKMDRSNLFVTAKAVEDGICDALGVDDGDEENWRLTCTQEKPPKGATYRYAVRIEIRQRAAEVA